MEYDVIATACNRSVTMECPNVELFLRQQSQHFRNNVFLKPMISNLKYAKDPKPNIKQKCGLTHVPGQAFEQPTLSL